MGARRFFDRLDQDLRYAAKMLRRAPALTAVAVFSLALGIGANTAIFTLIESTLLRPISLKHPERLRLLTWREQAGGWVPPNLGYLSATFGSIYEQRMTADRGVIHTDVSPSVYRALLRSNTVFDPLFTFKELGRVTAEVDGNAEPVNCFAVSGDFYRGMEVSPVIGRAIGPENDLRTEEGQVALISYEYWTRRFARSPSVIGKTITLNEIPVTIIGVNPEYFTGIEPGANFEIWAPLNLSAALIGRSSLDEVGAWQIPMMGRLKPAVSDARAQSELDALFQASVDANPGPIAGMLKDPAKRPRFILQSAARGVDYLNERYDGMLAALLALASLVLLIACANVANLLLAKSAARQHEISLRLALGSERWRMAQQLLTEGLLLASLAGVAGVILGYGARNAVPALLSTPWRPSLFDTTFDLRTLLASIAITLLTGVLFSLAPVWQSRRVELNEALSDGRGGASLSKLRIGRLLVTLQVAVSVLLVAGAGLCVETLSNLRNMPLGFKPDGLLLFNLDPPRLRYTGDRVRALLRELQNRLDGMPGVQSATFSRSGSETLVGSHFFEAMGIPILYGRDLDEHDSLQGLRAAIVNQAFARQYFPGQIAVGMTFRGAGNATYQIVGMCADWHYDRLRDTVQPALYTPGASNDSLPKLHQPSNPVTFEIRLAGDGRAVAREIRAAVRSVDASLAITDLRTGAQQIDDGLSQERLMASVAAVFSGLALILAAIGIYGAAAYAVARRTKEIGIRMALGARSGVVAWMVLREILALAAAGIAIGIPAVLGLSRVLDHVLAPGWQSSGFVYGTTLNDPRSMGFAALALAFAGAFGGYFPARRAARIDPMATLRHH